MQIPPFNFLLTTFCNNSCYFCKMKLANKILSCILLIPFLLLSTGVLVYSSLCTCTGSEQVSIYVTPETCNTDENTSDPACCSININEGSSNCCSGCQEHDNGCNCSDFDITYLKIKNQVANEAVRVAKPLPVTIFAELFPIYTITADLILDEDQVINDNEPPPKHKSSFDFLIQVNQLKIPHKA